MHCAEKRGNLSGARRLAGAMDSVPGGGGGFKGGNAWRRWKQVPVLVLTPGEAGRQRGRRDRASWAMRKVLQCVGEGENMGQYAGGQSRLWHMSYVCPRREAGRGKGRRARDRTEWRLIVGGRHGHGHGQLAAGDGGLVTGDARQWWTRCTVGTYST